MQDDPLDKTPDGPAADAPDTSDQTGQPPAEPETSEDGLTGRRRYKVSLDMYSGPLDLLLYLIKRDEIDINDIPVAYIADEYAKFLDMIAEWDINTAGEFLVLAATLMEIKSRMLLPDPPPVQEDEEFEDPRSELVRQLMEYKRFKEAALELADLAEERSKRFARPGERTKDEEERPLVMGIDVWRLAEAFQEILAATGADPAHRVVMDETPQEVYMGRLSARVEEAGRMGFQDLFRGQRSVSTLLGMFLALLELCRLFVLRAEQPETDGDIWMVFVPEDERPESVDPIRPDADTFGYAEMEARPERVSDYSVEREEDFAAAIEAVHPDGQRSEDDEPPLPADAEPERRDEASAAREAPVETRAEGVERSGERDVETARTREAEVEGPDAGLEAPAISLGQVSARLRWLGVAGLFRCPYSDWRPVKALGERGLSLVARGWTWKGMRVGLLLDAPGCAGPVKLVGRVRGRRSVGRGRHVVEIVFTPAGERGKGNSREALVAARDAARRIGDSG